MDFDRSVILRPVSKHGYRLTHGNTVRIKVNEVPYIKAI